MALVKILLKKAQQKKIFGMVDEVVVSYDNFVLVKASNAQIAEMKKDGFQVIPLDDLFIKIGSVTIDTNEPRIDKTGTVKPHPAYAHEESPGADRHHYIVQFVGPTKEEWKEEIIDKGGIIMGIIQRIRCPCCDSILELEINSVSTLPTRILLDKTKES